MRTRTAITWLALAAYLPLVLPVCAFAPRPTADRPGCCAACAAKRADRPAEKAPKNDTGPKCPCGPVCFACAKYLPPAAPVAADHAPIQAFDGPSDARLVPDPHPVPTLRPPRPV